MCKILSALIGNTVFAVLYTEGESMDKSSFKLTFRHCGGWDPLLRKYLKQHDVTGAE